MQAGFLVIEADAGHDGVLLLSKSDAMPDVKTTVPNDIVWVGRFKDIDAGQMHAHGYYCRELIDLERGAYTITKGHAIAAIEGDQLLQETVYIDPSLSPQDKEDRTKWELYYKRRKQIFEAVILLLKVISVGFLAFIFVMGL